MPGYFKNRRPCRKTSGENCRPLKKRKSSHEENNQAVKSTNKARDLVVKAAKKLKSSGENCGPCKKPKPWNSNSMVDPQMCLEIWDYVFSMEEVAESKTKSLDQRDCYMRNSVVEWLVEVADRNNFMSGTLHLAVSYLDRYLSKRNSDKLHLLSISCLLLASKYEDNRSTQPLVLDICSLADYSYTVQEVVDMEADILKYLDFEMGSPTVSTFLELEGFTPNVQEKNSPGFKLLVAYFAEITFLYFSCTKYLPSMIAASVVFLANFVLQPEIQPWSLALEQSTGYRASEIKECVLLIHDLHCRRSMDGLRSKYQRPEFSYISSVIPTIYFQDV